MDGIGQLNQLLAVRLKYLSETNMVIVGKKEIPEAGGLKQVGSGWYLCYVPNTPVSRLSMVASHSATVAPVSVTDAP